ncbi:DUF3173 family protein [Enterococcus sp. AZ188]|uniref:DUF3173 family protein n=1 Tax=Enterococcus sp. AZ188 TaxID=2774678 RepID=UPI003D2FDA81
MEDNFDLMVGKADLINMGFKPNQAAKMLKEAKEFLVRIEGIEFYSNRQISVVPARIIEKLFYLKISK